MEQKEGVETGDQGGNGEQHIEEIKAAVERCVDDINEWALNYDDKSDMDGPSVHEAWNILWEDVLRHKGIWEIATGAARAKIDRVEAEAPLPLSAYDREIFQKMREDLIAKDEANLPEELRFYDQGLQKEASLMMMNHPKISEWAKKLIRMSLEGESWPENIKKQRRWPNN